MRTIFFDKLLHALSWSFLHSLWQGLILTILAGLVMLGTKRSGASLRYVFLCMLFFVFLGGVAITFIIEWNAATGGSSGLTFIAHAPDLQALSQHSLFRQLFEGTVIFLDSNSQWIVLAWLFILVFRVGRMTLDMIYLHRLQKHQTFSPIDEWKIKVQALSQSLGIRKKVALLESALVKIPIVVGHFKPVILVPLGILTQLAPGEVEAVLLHELAHIRRNDYFVNFIQRIAELLFFFNPGLLWVSSLLRIERENCCDDIAIAKTNNKVQFVAALISFKEHSLKHPVYALGLFGKRNLLLQRVTRIVYNRNKALSRSELVFFTLSLILFLFLATTVSRPKPLMQTATVPNSPYVDPALSFILASKENKRPVPERKTTPTISTIKQIQFSSAKKQSPLLTFIDAKEVISPDENPYSKDLHFEQTQQADLEHDLVQEYKEEMDKDREQAALDRNKADKDRQQADIDRKEADKYRQHAEKDREQADRDRLQADKDRLQADKDRRQAEDSRKQADKDRVLSEKSAQQPFSKTRVTL